MSIEERDLLKIAGKIREEEQAQREVNQWHIVIAIVLVILIGFIGYTSNHVSAPVDDDIIQEIPASMDIVPKTVRLKAGAAQFF